MPALTPQSAPADLARPGDPARVNVRLGGCNRAATAVVSGLAVDGSADYTLRTEAAEPTSVELRRTVDPGLDGAPYPSCGVQADGPIGASCSLENVYCT